MSIRSHIAGHSHARSASADRTRRLRSRLVDREMAQALADTFSLLGDPTRTRILHALALSELCVSEIADLLEISPSATSHQLRLLRDRRLVGGRRAGKRAFYHLEDEHIRTLVDMAMSHISEPEHRGWTRR